MKGIIIHGLYLAGVHEKVSVTVIVTAIGVRVGLLSLQLVAIGGCGYLKFVMLSDSLMYFLCALSQGCLLPGLACTFLLGCLLNFLSLVGLVK